MHQGEGRGTWAALAGLAMMVAGVCGGLASGQARADSVGLAFLGARPAERVGVYLDTDHNGGYDYDRRVTAGVMNWAVSGTGQSLATFCIELTQRVSRSTTVYDLYDDLTAMPRTDGVTITAAKARKLGAFWGQFRDRVIDSDTASAFQVGIWEIVYDGDGVLDVSREAGAFYVEAGGSSADTYGVISRWLGELDLNGPSARLRGLVNASRQDQLTAVVPTPTAAVAGLALLGLAGLRRRRGAV